MVFRRGASLSITWNELLQPKVHRSNRSAFRLSLNCIPTYALKHPAAKISPTPTASLYISSASCIGQKGNVGAAALERPPISSRLHHVLRRYAFDLDHHAFKLHRGRVHTFTRNDRIFVPCVRTQDDARTWIHVSMHGAWHHGRSLFVWFHVLDCKRLYIVIGHLLVITTILLSRFECFPRATFNSQIWRHSDDFNDLVVGGSNPGQVTKYYNLNHRLRSQIFIQDQQVDFIDTCFLPQAMHRDCSSTTFLLAVPLFHRPIGSWRAISVW